MMEVILRDDIKSLGKAGELVRVKPGYARNFLFPQGAAYEANVANVRRLSEEKKKYDQKTLREQGIAQTAAMSPPITPAPTTCTCRAWKSEPFPCCLSRSCRKKMRIRFAVVG